MEDNRVTYFGITDSRNKQIKFGIRREDRLKHMYVIGKTGMGKSTLLENMAIQDIQNGEGLAFLDPHGKTVDLLMEYVPEHRIKDVIYVAPFDLEHPVAFNVLEDTSGDAELNPVRAQLIVSGLMSTFKKIWKDQWSARMEYILNYTLLALLEIPEATLLDVNRMLSDKKFRNDVVARVKEPTVKMYWEKEFANYTEKQAAEAVPAIQNKVGQFISNSLIRNIIGQKFSSFDLRRAMDEKKIILFNLSIGRIGEDAVNLLGSLFVTKIYLAAMSRADKTDRELKELPPFYLYVDEFQNFTNDSFAQILAQSRKYKLGLIVAHQYVKQMTDVVRDAVFGNVGTMIAFRVGAEDGEALEKEFQPTFTVEDFVNLGRYQMYLKLMIDGVTSGAFSAINLGPWPESKEQYVQQILSQSRDTYTRPRAEVEKHILEWTLGNTNGGNNTGNNGKGSNDTGEKRNHTQSTGQAQHVNHSKPKLAETPRYIKEDSTKKHLPQTSHQESIKHPETHHQTDIKMPPIPQIPPSKPKNMNPVQPQNQTPKVHNPFKSAFAEMQKEQGAQPAQIVKTVEDSEKKIEDKKVETKEVDEDTLKSVLGL